MLKYTSMKHYYVQVKNQLVPSTLRQIKEQQLQKIDFIQQIQIILNNSKIALDSIPIRQNQFIINPNFKCNFSNTMFIIIMDESWITNKFNQLVNYIRSSNVDEVRRVLAQTPQQIVNRLQTQNRQPPIFFACMLVRQDTGLEIIKLLLGRGANPNFKDNNQQTVLYYLARDGKQKILQYLIKHHEFKPQDVDYSEQTPIYYAAVQNRVGTLQLLVEHGWNVNHKDKNNQTCLFYAARQGHFQACKLLIHLGIQIFHQDNLKHNALYFARKNSRKNVIELLNAYKQDDKKIREIQKVKEKVHTQTPRESSIVENKKKKREAPKNQYCLIFTDQAGNVHQLDDSQLEQFRKHHEKIYNFLLNPQFLEQQPIPPQKKFQKTANKILNHFWKLPHGYLFHEPVDYVKLNIPDYPTIVKKPMDFGTIKIKLQNNAYENHHRFVQDMILVFDNCILYNGSENDVGKIGINMKLEFNGMCKQFYNSVLL